MRSTIRILAPAKINLARHVVGKRADGYHMLETLAVFAEFGDEIFVTPSETDSFSVDGPFARDVPTDGGNLVLRARDALRDHWRSTPLYPIAIRLTKNLPIASGIGGGSSDAAATLRALNQAWGLGLTTTDLAGIAAPLGADLPMCIAARPLIARGIGERIDRLDRFPALHVLLVNPRREVATPAVFKRLPTPTNPTLPPLPDRRTAGDIAAWLASTRNDLQAPAIAIEPSIADCLAALEKAGARFARMSGSGATCFGLFASDDEAALAAAKLTRDHPGWFVAATRTAASED